MRLPEPPDFILDADLLAVKESREKLFSILKDCDNFEEVRLLVVKNCLEKACQKKDLNSITSSLEDYKIEVEELVNVDSKGEQPSRLDNIHDKIPDWDSAREVECAHQQSIRYIITNELNNFLNLDEIPNTPSLTLWTLDDFKKQVEPSQQVEIPPSEVTPARINEVPEIPEDPHIPIVTPPTLDRVKTQGKLPPQEEIPPPELTPPIIKKDPKTTKGKKKSKTTKGKKKVYSTLAIIAGIGFLAYLYLIKGSSNQPTIVPKLVVGDDISRGEEMLPFPSLSNESCKVERQSKEEVISATEIFQNAYNQKNSETPEQKKNDYKDALDNFDKAITKDIYDPELSIYQQNAFAHDTGNVLTIAVVVPFSEKKSDGSTKYESYCNRTVPILRGVAMAQKEINTGEAIKINGNNYYLEIVIANDENDKNFKAKNIAQRIIKDKTILGVIGHNSSAATGEALKEYNNNLVVVTSTSTASELGNKIEEDKNNSKWWERFYPQNMRRWFYRAVISDEISSQKLADYLKKIKKDKISIIYEKGDKYSEGYLKSFQNQTNFPQENILKIFEFDPTQKRVKEIKDFKIRKEVSAKDIVEDSISSGVKSTLIFTQSQDTKDFVLEVMKENAERSYPLVMLGGNSLYECDKLGENSEGLILSVPWFQGSNDNTKSFNEKASEKWGGDINWRTATSYDAVKVFYNAFLQLQNITREDLADRMQQGQGIDIPPAQTSGDPLKFNNKGERLGNISSGLVQVKKSNKKGCGGYSFEKVE